MTKMNTIDDVKKALKKGYEVVDLGRNYTKKVQFIIDAGTVLECLEKDTIIIDDSVFDDLEREDAFEDFIDRCGSEYILVYKNHRPGSECNFAYTLGFDIPNEHIYTV